MRRNNFCKRMIDPERFESMRNSNGSMPLALLLTAFVLMISLSATTALVWQTETTANQDAKVELATALNSGIAAAAQQAGPASQVGGAGSSTPAADCSSLPMTRPTTWNKNTETAPSGSLNTATRNESGMYRWWADCSDSTKGIVRVSVEAKAGTTYDTNNSASAGAQKVVNLTFSNGKLVSMTPAGAAAAINPGGPGNLLPSYVANGGENGMPVGWNGSNSPSFSSSKNVAYQDKTAIRLTNPTATTSPTLSLCLTAGTCNLDGSINNGWFPWGTYNPFSGTYTWDAVNNTLTVDKGTATTDTDVWRGWEDYTASPGDQFTMSGVAASSISGTGQKVTTKFFARSWTGAPQTSTSIEWVYSSSVTNGTINFNYTVPATAKTVEFGVEMTGVGSSKITNLLVSTNATKWFPRTSQQDGSATYVWDGSTLVQSVGSGTYARAWTSFPLSGGTTGDGLTVSFNFAGTIASVTNGGNVRYWARAWNGEVSQSTSLDWQWSSAFTAGSSAGWTYTLPKGTKYLEVGVDVNGTNAVATINNLVTKAIYNSSPPAMTANTVYTESGWYYAEQTGLSVQNCLLWSNGSSSTTSCSTQALTQGKWVQAYTTATSPASGYNLVGMSWAIYNGGSAVPLNSVVYGDEFAIRLGSSP